MVTKESKIRRVDSEIEEIAQRILLELEGASSSELSDDHYARKMLHLSDVNYAKGLIREIGISKVGDEHEMEKKAVIKVLLFSTWLQRLYFIIRSAIMGLLSGAVTFLLIFSVGSINALTGFVFGIFVFGLSLFITRLFDAQITQATKIIVEIMDSHRKTRDFIMKHF